MKLGFPLTLRSLVLGALLSMVVAAYSAFAGLQAGGVYWPIVTTSLISLAVLRALGGTDKNEVNIMQTAGSTGGLLAGAIIFTIPAAFLLGFRFSVLEITAVSLVGGTIGIIFSAPLRRQLIEKEKLPYADGAAAAAMLNAGDRKGGKSRLLFGSLGISAAYAAVASYLKAVPPIISARIASFEVSSLTSVIPFAGGFLIGPRFTAAWFAGTVAGLFLAAQYAGLKAFELGIGVIIGASIAYFAVKGLPLLPRILSDWRKARAGRLEGLAIIISVGVLTLLTNLNLGISIAALVGAFVMAFVAARITGEMNVDPLEVFAFIVMLAVKVLVGFGQAHLVLLTAVVAIAAGMAGDFLQDLKSGHILGTKPEHQIVSQLVGLVSAALVIGVVLLSLESAYGFGSDVLPAPQAQALKGIISQEGISTELIAGFAFGAVAFFLSDFAGWGLAPVAFGIGLYVPVFLSLPLFVGGMARYAAEKTAGRKLEGRLEAGRIIAAGLIAGAGVVSVLLAMQSIPLGALF